MTADTRRMRRPFQLAMWALIIGCSAATRADIVTLTAASDATLYSEDDNKANGAGDYFFAGRTDGGNLRRGLVRFDLSGIPAGSTINSASVSFYMSRTIAGNQSVGLHRVLASWGEGASNADGQEGSPANAELNDATWRYRFYNSANPGASPQWATLGGQYTLVASASSVVGAANGTYTWTSSGLAADVAAWVASPSANFGWIAVGNESTNTTAKRFNSRTSSNSARRPMLTVNYTPPATTGACCLPGGVCQVLTSTECGSMGGTYQGNGSSCSPNPCPQPTGACCFGDGMCMELSAVDCAAQGGTYQGNGTSCTPNPCPVLMGACCLPSGLCVDVTATQCAAQNGDYRGDSTMCAMESCPIELTPYLDPLPLPAIAQPVTGTPGGAAHYDIAVREVYQTLHSELPPTRVWGYGGSYPGPTIVATRGQPVTVQWRNDLRVFETQQLRMVHTLPVDTCLHGPDVTGQVPVIVTHLHGGKVDSVSDGQPEATFPPGGSASTVYQYPNDQRAATIWYHDHALGITRLNVYMGLAGFYILTDEDEQALNIPRGEYDIGMAIQDRSFNPDGSLKYLDMWHEHFFGDFVLVNGKVWPYLNVKRGLYRFRLLNGSGSRAYTLSLSDNATFWQIGSDLGLLEAPVPMTQLTITPGERADVVMDFGGYAPGTEIILTNSAHAPFPNGPSESVVPNVMKFIVQADPGHTTPLPAQLVPVARIPESEAVLQRNFQLQRMPNHHCPEHMDGMWMINGLMWDDITEYPRVGSTEVWAWINRSGVVHPMHMHLVAFQVLDRQDFQVVDGVVTPVGPRMPPPLNEMGWKDTVQAMPGQITRVIARFEDYTGRYPYHCHILEHEDHEMMRQFEVICDAPFITQQPAPAQVAPGESAGFTVVATGDVLAYRWRRNGVPLADGPAPGGGTIGGSETPTLTITGAQEADEASFDCVLTNPCGNATSAVATLLVTPPPCPGDANGDGLVNAADLSVLLAQFDQSVTPGTGADFNGDGLVNAADLSVLLATFGSAC